MRSFLIAMMCVVLSAGCGGKTDLEKELEALKQKEQVIDMKERLLVKEKAFNAKTVQVERQISQTVDRKFEQLETIFRRPVGKPSRTFGTPPTTKNFLFPPFPTTHFQGEREDTVRAAELRKFECEKNLELFNQFEGRIRDLNRQNYTTVFNPYSVWHPGFSATASWNASIRRSAAVRANALVNREKLALEMEAERARQAVEIERARARLRAP